MFSTKNLSFKDFIFYDDIVIEKEKINFINGKSGCGKSTLLKLFNRTANFSSGDIFYNNRSINEFDSIALRKEVKLISQTTYLFQGTIRENFELYYDYCEENDLTDEKMKSYLAITEANFPLDSFCDNLSGGERQRVYIAICLSMEANTVMLDEPTSALDYNLSQRLLENIIAYIKQKNKTLIVISHDSKLSNKYAENLITITGGARGE